MVSPTKKPDRKLSTSNARASDAQPDPKQSSKPCDDISPGQTTPATLRTGNVQAHPNWEILDPRLLSAPEAAAQSRDQVLAQFLSGVVQSLELLAASRATVPVTPRIGHVDEEEQVMIETVLVEHEALARQCLQQYTTDLELKKDAPTATSGKKLHMQAAEFKHRLLQALLHSDDSVNNDRNADDAKNITDLSLNGSRTLFQWTVLRFAPKKRARQPSKKSQVAGEKDDVEVRRSKRIRPPSSERQTELDRSESAEPNANRHKSKGGVIVIGDSEPSDSN